jgi:hypothetical protein
VSSPDRPDIEEVREHAEFNAREGTSEIGAGVVRTEYRDGAHVWECIVTDGQQWHYIEVIGSGLDAFPDLSTEDIEQGIDRFAATLPAEDRLYALLEANPLHVDRTGQITD